MNSPENQITKALEAIQDNGMSSESEILGNRIKQLEETLLQALIHIDEENGETEEDSRFSDWWAEFHGTTEDIQ